MLAAGVWQRLGSIRQRGQDGGLGGVGRFNAVLGSGAGTVHVGQFVLQKMTWRCFPNLVLFGRFRSVSGDAFSEIRKRFQ
jgi:hypothetical protein